MANFSVKYCFLTIYVFVAFLATAQDVYEKNYVPNGSFENYRKKSSNIKILTQAAIANLVFSM